MILKKEEDKVNLKSTQKKETKVVAPVTKPATSSKQTSLEAAKKKKLEMTKSNVKDNSPAAKKIKSKK